MSEQAPKPNLWRRWAFAAVFAFFLLSGLVVVSRQSFSSKAAQLRPGMTRAEVFEVMGHPDHLVKLGDMEIALFTPLPFDLHALFTKPGQTLSGNASILAEAFPVYIEFYGDRADRVRVEGREVEGARLKKDEGGRMKDE